MIDKGRQILFKVLRMDVGSEHLLAWCKSNARNKINTQINGDERVNLRLAGTIGDVTYDVKAEGPRGGNISVKIMLAAAQDVSAYFGFSSSVVMRCWCRKVGLAQVRVTEATARSVAYLTDGTELASVPITETATEFRSYFSLQGLIPGFTNEYGWHSSGILAIYEATTADGVVYRTNVLGYQAIAIPEDVCYQNDAGDYPVHINGDTGLSGPYAVGRIVLAHTDLGVFNLFGELDGFKYTVYGSSTEFFAEAEGACIAHITNILSPNKGNGERREYARRKNCSDGMYTYLQNGFLPPEFEYFIKATAPKSNLLKRDIPISITSGPTYTTGPNVFINATDFTKTVTGTVTVEYTTTDVNGVSTTHTHTLEGTATRTTIADKNNTGNIARAPTEYIDFPMVNTTGVDTAPAGGIFPPSLNSNLNNLYGLASGKKLLSDQTNIAYLLNIANGIENNSGATSYSWRETDQYGTAFFNPDTTEPGVIEPVPVPTSTSVVFTHPQFLYEYIAASKPVEAEAPETPSTNWLSSRLIDGETITVIPLSFINADGEDRGMYPLSVTDEVPVQLKITGYAKTRFNYKTASFTEPVWTEFDAPRFINYETAWGSKNCVCIAGKNLYTDTKAAAKTQREHLKSPPPDGYTPTAEERLYLAVKQALATN